MKLMLLGAPGAGKGTQGEIICKGLNIPSISTGNMIREALKNKTKMGLEAKGYMDKGELVPDEVVIGIVKDRLSLEDCQKGFLLDGFPRTVPQGKALESMGIQLDKVIEIQANEEIIIERMTGRRVCEECGATYHVQFHPSKEENRCDKCEGKLMVREDDKPETVKARLGVYKEQTEPLVNYYKKAGILVSIDGMKKIEEITKKLSELLGVAL